MNKLPQKPKSSSTPSRTSTSSLQGDISRRVGNMRSVIMRGQPINTDQIFGVTRTIQERGDDHMCFFP